MAFQPWDICQANPLQCAGCCPFLLHCDKDTGRAPLCLSRWRLLAASTELQWMSYALWNTSLTVVFSEHKIPGPCISGLASCEAQDILSESRYVSGYTRLARPQSTTVPPSLSINVPVDSLGKTEV